MLWLVFKVALALLFTALAGLCLYVWYAIDSASVYSDDDDLEL